jgi:hypothetical protein
MSMAKKLHITDRKRFEATWWALHGPDCYEQNPKVWFARSRMWGPKGYSQPIVHFAWESYQRGFIAFGKNLNRIERTLQRSRLPRQKGGSDGK